MQFLSKYLALCLFSCCSLSFFCFELFKMAHKSHIVVETVSSANAGFPYSSLPSLPSLPPTPSCCVYVSESYAEQQHRIMSACLSICPCRRRLPPCLSASSTSPPSTISRPVVPPPSPSVCCLLCYCCVHAFAPHLHKRSGSGIAELLPTLHKRRRQGKTAESRRRWEEQEELEERENREMLAASRVKNAQTW